MNFFPSLHIINMHISSPAKTCPWKNPPFERGDSLNIWYCKCKWRSRATLFVILSIYFVKNVYCIVFADLVWWKIISSSLGSYDSAPRYETARNAFTELEFYCWISKVTLKYLAYYNLSAIPIFNSRQTNGYRYIILYSING